MNQPNPQTPSYPKLNYDSIKILLGSAIILFAFLGFINFTVVSGFIHYIITLFVGFFNSMFLLLIAMYGFFLIVTKRTIPLKFNFTTMGFVIVAIAITGIISFFSLVASPEINLNLLNFFDTFRDNFPKFNDIPVVTYDPIIGGGVFGYFVLTLAITLVGNQFAIYVLYLILFVGFVMSLELVWKQLIAYFTLQAEIQKREREHYMAITTMGEVDASTKPSFSDRSSFTPPRVESSPSLPPMNEPSVNVGSPRSPMPPRKQIVPTSNGIQRVLPRRPGSVAAPTNPTPPLEPMPSVPTEQPRVQVDAPRFEPVVIPTIADIEPAQPSPPILNRRSTFQTAFPTRTVPMTQPVEPVASIPSTLQDPLLVGLRKTRDDEKYLDYQMPSLTLLDNHEDPTHYEINERRTKERIDRIHAKFAALGVAATIVGYQVGPSVTSFDVKMNDNAQASQVKKILSDLGIALGGFLVSFNEIVPGKPVSSLEVSNEVIATVGFKEMMSDVLSQEKTASKIVVPFGRDIQGKVITLSPKEIVHMLIAGATGSGKSVFIHSLITSLIYKARPDQVKLMLVDPKRVELSKYKAIPHLLCPIISDFDEAKVAVERLYIEMENRYKIFQAAECTSLEQYLQFAQQHNLKPLPYIFAILDEYNDLVEGMPQVSDWVQRIAQKSRAAGIHIVLATQRPTTNVVTGNVKNNMVTKVALRVASPIDSMTVLGHAGSEVLMGNGDMFLANPLFNRTGEIRVQGAYISDEEIMKVTQYMREKYAPDYYPSFLNLVDKSAMGPAYSPTVENEEDELYDIVCEALVNMEFVSLNAIMTTYGVGFNRAKGIFKRLQTENKIEIRKDNLQNNRGAKVLIYQGKRE